jgi:hypothetical protein
MKALHGTFYVPSDPNDTFGGIFRRVEGGLELEVVGWDTIEGRQDILLGTLADGNAITLVELRRKTMRIGVNGARPIYRVWHALIGWRFDALADIAFDRASCTFTDLSEWWSWSQPFALSDGVKPAGLLPVPGPTVVMTYTREPSITAVLSDLEIEAGPKESQSINKRGYRIETQARVRFRWAARQSLKRVVGNRWREWLTPIERVVVSAISLSERMF